MNTYTRAQIRLNGDKDALDFVSMLNSDGSAYKYYLENKDGKERVDARSLLGVLYFLSLHNDDTFLVNDTKDGNYPKGVDDFRA